VSEYREVTIETIDRAIKDWFDLTVNPRVMNSDGSMRKVPVQFSQGERWSIGRTKQTFRDENGVLILPIIAIRRTGIEPDPTKLALGVQTKNIQISKKIDPKTNEIKNLEHLKPEQIKRLYPAIYDVYTIPFPERMVAKYQIIVQAQYITQMNETLQKIWRTLDNQRSFVAPFDNDGRQPPRASQYGTGNPYNTPGRINFSYVVGFMENEAGDSGNFEEFTDTERIIKYTTDITVPFALQTSPEGIPAPVQVERTAYKLVLKDENWHFVDDPDELDKIFGKLR
jgi:hypothetical protein